MSKNILLIMENLKINSKLALLEESSNASFQHRDLLINNFISETTDMVLNEYFLERTHLRLIDNINNLIIESEDVESEDNEDHTVRNVLGTSALIYAGSKYDKIKDFTTTNYKKAKDSSAVSSYKNAYNDVKRGARIARDVVKKGLRKMK